MAIARPRAPPSAARRGRAVHLPATPPADQRRRAGWEATLAAARGSAAADAALRALAVDGPRPPPRRQGQFDPLRSHAALADAARLPAADADGPHSSPPTPSRSATRRPPWRRPPPPRRLRADDVAARGADADRPPTGSWRGSRRCWGVEGSREKPCSSVVSSVMSGRPLAWASGNRLVPSIHLRGPYKLVHPLPMSPPPRTPLGVRVLTGRCPPPPLVWLCSHLYPFFSFVFFAAGASALETAAPLSSLSAALEAAAVRGS